MLAKWAKTATGEGTFFRVEDDLRLLMTVRSSVNSFSTYRQQLTLDVTCLIPLLSRMSLPRPHSASRSTSSRPAGRTRSPTRWTRSSRSVLMSSSLTPFAGRLNLARNQSLSAGMFVGLQHWIQRQRPMYKAAYRTLEEYLATRVERAREKIRDGGEIAEIECLVSRHPHPERSVPVA